MQTISKMHEKNVQNNVHVEKVDTILSDVENVPFALRGATVKTILYWLFSVIAAAELSGAFFFYISSFEMPQVAAAMKSTLSKKVKIMAGPLFKVKKQKRVWKRRFG